MYPLRRKGKLTIVNAIPAIFSLRVQNPAMSRMMTVIGTAAQVR